MVASMVSVSFGAVGSTHGPMQEEPRQQIVTLDQIAADYLQPRLSDVPVEVLFEDFDALPDAITKRAWSMRHATYLVFHGDRLRPISRIYCERLQTQGVRLVDLKDVGVTMRCDCGRDDGARFVHPARRSKPAVALKATFAMNLSCTGVNQ